jgi:uncharacterized protein involved in exopolysaccharide biosynthesis
MVTPAPHPSLHDALRVLFRHKVKAILFLVFSLAVAVAAAFLLPKAYRSEGRLLVRLGWENARPDPVTTLGEASVVTSFGQIREFEVNSVVAILQSRAIIEKVVESLGPATVLGEDEPAVPANEQVARPAVDQPRSSGVATFTVTGRPAMSAEAEAELEQRSKAINVLSDNLTVEAIPKSNVIVVAYEGESPELSQVIVAELMDIYVGQHAQLNRPRGAHEFLARQTKDLYAILTQTEQELLLRKKEADVVSPSHWREELTEQMGVVDRALLETSAEEVASEARIAALQEKLAGLPDTEVTAKHTGPDRALAGMREELYRLEMREQRLLADSTEDFFELQQIRNQKERARAILDGLPPLTEETEGPSRRYQEVHLALLQEEPVLAALQAKTKRLRQQRAELADQLRTFNDRDLQIRRLEREVDLQDAKYRQYVANLEQARIDQALEDERISSISIVQPASFEIEPVRPRKLLNLAIGLMLGVFGGVGVAFLSEYVSDSLRTPGGVKRDSEPEVPGSVPQGKR